jgi:hypothetical protein
MQWDRIGRGLPQFRPETDGWDYREPDQGRLAPNLLSRVMVILNHASPAAGRAGLWEGNGALYPGSSSVVVLSGSGPDDDATDAPAGIDLSIPFAPVEWENRKLELPERAYFVFEGDLGRLSEPDWMSDSGWGAVTSFWGDTPNLLWPTDRSWFLVSEIDLDSTVIGCSAEMAAELLADEMLETALIPEGASLAMDGDQINR